MLPAVSYGAAIVVPPDSTVISSWSFDAVTLSGAATPTISAGPADIGAQLSGSLATGVHASTATVYSTPAGNGSAKSFSSNNWGLGDYYQFTLDATGFDNINVTFGQFRSSSGPADFKLSYSTDGVSFTDVPFAAASTYPVPTAPSWSSVPSSFQPTEVFSFDLSSTAVLNNDSSIFFRLVDATVAPTAAAGTGRVDDFTVSDGPVQLIAAVPEPDAAITTLGGVGLSSVCCAAAACITAPNGAQLNAGLCAERPAAVLHARSRERARGLTAWLAAGCRKETAG